MSDELDHAVIELKPEDNVYSYLMFVCPIMNTQKAAGARFRKYLAFIVVLCSLILQATLTYAIYKVIVLGDAEWRLSVIDTGAGEGCTKGGALCSFTNGTYSCAPPSVRLAGAGFANWDQLDTNNDGIWTRDEVLAAKEDLQCKYAVNPVEVFDVFINYLLLREDLIWLHPDVKAGKGIHRPYFTYAGGDIIMCGYRNTDMCTNLLMRGIFDAPLVSGLAPRVGKTIESALDYCFELLQDGGTCDRLLPSTYTVWKKSSVDQCLGADYGKVTYQHPRDGKEKSLLEVDYTATQNYQRASNSLLFMMYQSCVVAIFFLAMVAELKDILPVFTWVVQFPSDKDIEGDAVEAELKPESGEIHYTIKGISTEHRVVMMIIVFLRVLMLIGLCCVGVVFLLKTTSYLDLILNGLGILFVVELSNTVYSQMISPHLQEECNNIESMKVEMLLPNLFLNKNRALKDMVWAFLLLLIVCACMVSWKHSVVAPVTTALECACLTSGETCQEANQFSKGFWKTYWNDDVPSVFSRVDELKASSGASLVNVTQGSNATGGVTVEHSLGEVEKSRKRPSLHRSLF